MSEQVNPGIHPSVYQKRCFSNIEFHIIERFGREWYVTRGEEILLSKSKYRYILIKPTPLYQEMFNLDREIVVVFSDYEIFEPRTLDAFDHVRRSVEKLRVDKICCVMVRFC